MKHPLVECRYCHESVGEGTLARHEKACKDATPELREIRKRARDVARALPDRQRTPSPQGARRNGKATRAVGPRMSVTLSLDFETLRRLLLELAPSVSIDRVTVQ